MRLPDLTRPLLLVAIFLGFMAVKAAATTYYVDVNSANPTPPYTSWATASTDIQSAVNETTNGDLVLVNPGVYQSGGYTAPDGGLSCVVDTNAITLQSVNGAAGTLICGNNAMRCVYLADGSILSGFTLTNGLIHPIGGGMYCASTNVLVSNCLFIGNTANGGGGAYSGTLNNCTLQGNSAAMMGGGAFGSFLNNCIIIGNSLTNSGAMGGGAANCTLNNCFLNGNFAYTGGGAYLSILNNCIVSNNVAIQIVRFSEPGFGGGVSGGTAQNCLIISNSAQNGQLAQMFPNETEYYSAGGGSYGSTLVHCILQGNVAGLGGGAADGERPANAGMSDCIIVGNSAILGGGFWYGGNGATVNLTNCVICGNEASQYGGVVGLEDAVFLLNCSVIGNSATNSYGGIFDVVAENSIVYYNNAPQFPDAGGNYSVQNCCFGPDVTSGSGFFTNAPLFVNLAAGDFHLQSNSPCINAGNNSYVTTTTDLDGNPRIVGGMVDIGAYEYQTPVSMTSYEWLEQYALPVTNGIDTSSPNGTPFDVYQDWIAGLNPTNPASVLMMLSPTITTNASGVTVSWESVSGIDYNVLRATNVVSSFTTIQANITGQAGTTSYTDTTATNGGPYFYRVAVP